MDELKILLDELVEDTFVSAILSNPTDKEYGSKVKVRPVNLKGALFFQHTLYKGTKVFHENLDAGELKKKLLEEFTVFKQAELVSEKMTVHVLVSKKGKITVKKKYGAVVQAVPTEHNRAKKYILEEGKPVPFLVGLGVQTADGTVVRSKYNKFKQINRYLEFIEDIVKKLPEDRTVRIVDFGCGKSYLTFAMYYYLRELRGYEVEITGLDLKEDVIALCNKLATEYGYSHLHFEMGDISTYSGAEKVDMVVTLHACDTATDYAIEKAVKWGAEVIMVVPCCQHELNRQIKNEELKPILKYGVIKERMAALITDALRADLLEEQGYDTQILEFIDMEHTPKNLLIRAVKKSGMRKRGDEADIQKKHDEIKAVTDFLHVDPTLRKLL
ncbi:MAG: class I SAM-dependent methyltransferase [Lachnospiraceae bacterium]